MKKTIFTLFALFLLSAGAFSQMSFQPVKLKKSSFDLTDNQKNLISHDDNTSTILISDEDNDMTKKRRRGGRSRGRGRGSSDFSNSIKINPLSILFGTAGVMYERKIADNMSLGLTGGIYFNDMSVMTLQSKYSGFNISPEFRYYFESAIEGWFAGAFFSYTSITNSQKYTDGTAIAVDENGNDVMEIKNTVNVIGGGAFGGRQWIWGGFTLDVYAGLGYTSVSWTYDKYYSPGLGGGLSLEGILPVLGAAIGYSF